MLKQITMLMLISVIIAWLNFDYATYLICKNDYEINTQAKTTIKTDGLFGVLPDVHAKYSYQNKDYKGSRIAPSLILTGTQNMQIAVNRTSPKGFIIIADVMASKVNIILICLFAFYVILLFITIINYIRGCCIVNKIKRQNKTLRATGSPEVHKA